MMDNYKTKEFGASKPNDNGPAPITIRAVSQIKNEYHFPGVPDWEPINIVASTIEEAQELWKTLRKPVNPDAKVDEEEKDNNKE